MFSGIVKELASVDRIDGKTGGGASLALNAPVLAPGAWVGDSIAVNGVCLTVVAADADRLSFDLSPETLRVTDLGDLKPGDRCNLEDSLCVGDQLGGHFVTGHIDGVGRITRKDREGDCFVFGLEIGRNLTGMVIDRGSIAVDGISLTVTKISGPEIEVVIIPHTAAVTTLGIKGPGDRINIEADMIGKYVAKLLGKTEE